MVLRRNREPPVVRNTRLCCLACAGIEIFNYDPLQDYTNVIVSCELFLDDLSISTLKIIISNLME